MSLLVLALLVGLWSAILVPGAIRSRRAASPGSAEAFHAALERLVIRAQQEKAQAAAATVPAGGLGDASDASDPRDPGDATAVSELRAQAARRAQRRRWIVGGVLGVLLLVGAVGTVAVHRGFVWLLLTVALLATGYAGLLYGMRVRAEEIRRKVTPLPQRTPSPSPTPPASGDAAALPTAAGDHP